MHPFNCKQTPIAVPAIWINLIHCLRVAMLTRRIWRTVLSSFSSSAFAQNRLISLDRNLRLSPPRRFAFMSPGFNFVLILWSLGTPICGVTGAIIPGEVGPPVSEVWSWPPASENCSNPTSSQACPSTKSWRSFSSSSSKGSDAEYPSDKGRSLTASASSSTSWAMGAESATIFCRAFTWRWPKKSMGPSVMPIRRSASHWSLTFLMAFVHIMHNPSVAIRSILALSFPIQAPLRHAGLNFVALGSSP